MMFGHYYTRVVTVWVVLFMCVCLVYEEHHVSYKRQQSESRKLHQDTLDTIVQVPLLDVCQYLRVPSVRAPEPDEWQTVVAGQYYVYSAYADPRPENHTLVRILGLMPVQLYWSARPGETYWCQVWVAGSQVPFVLRSNYTVQGHADEK